jgi:inorganic phosphate transporter, PiT family
MSLAILFLAAAALAYANGANDNLKGVATLLGSGTTSYRGALLWGTATTLAGSALAWLFTHELLAAFSGRGIVAGSLVGDPRFLSAVGLGAALVVLLATWRGLPISTTHALVGALAGAGVSAEGIGGIAWAKLGTSFALPLLISPLLAGLLVAFFYPVFQKIKRQSGVKETSCICVTSEEPTLLAAGNSGVFSLADMPKRREFLAASDCRVHGDSTMVGITAARVLDILHYISAGAVGFARGLNDTPKIAAIIMATGAASSNWAVVLVGAVMASGALLQAAKVGKTLSFDITKMNAGQGFSANLATAAMVFGASRLGVPVSTTHVSVGSLFGLGRTNNTLVGATVKRILLAWIGTLPLGFLFALIAYRIL